MHRAELVHLEEFAVLAYALELNQDAIQTACYDLRAELTTGYHIIQVAFLAFVNDLKTTIAQTSHDFRLAQHAVLALCDIEIQTRCHKEFRQYALVTEESDIVEPTYYRRKAIQDITLGYRLWLIAAYPNTIVRQFVIDRCKQLGHTTNLIEGHEIDNGIKAVARQLLDIVQICRTQSESIATIQINILLYVTQNLFLCKIQYALLQCLFVAISQLLSRVEYSLRSAFRSFYRLVIGIQCVAVCVLEN